LRTSRERVRGPVELADAPVRVADDLEQLALLRAGDAAEAVFGLLPEDRRRQRRRCCRVAELQPSLPERDHDLAPLRPPAPEQRLELGRDGLCGLPGLRLPRVCLDRLHGQLPQELLDLHARAGVDEDDGAGPFLRRDGQAREEPRHRPAVADEDAVALAQERDAEPPADLPLLQVGHRLEPAHLLRRLARKHPVGALDDERPPAGEVSRRRPERPGGGERALDQALLRPDGIAVRVDEIRPRGRRLGLEHRALEPQRVEQPLPDVVLVVQPRAARDHLAEQRESEIGVVPARAGLEDLLGVREPGDEPLAVGKLERFPDVARHLALQAGQVREHPPQRRAAVRRLGDVLRERVVEVELAGVAQLHDRHRGEGLRDRSDAILRVRRRLDGALDVRDAVRLLPDDRAVPDDGRADRRDPLLGLSLADEPREVGDRRLRPRLQGR
jgi:hypothetical protein